MITDARNLPANTTLDCDVAIVGAGAAGITLARELTGTSIDVCLLEAGGFTADDETQSLYRGENIGLPYFELDETRFRLFGGSTNRWAGWCRALDPIDFEHRPWVPHSGWPVQRSEIEPYYERARQVCELPSKGFDPNEWGSAIPPIYQPSLLNGTVGTILWHGSPPTKFGLVYRQDLERAPNVHTYLNANVVELETNDAGRQVTALRIKCLTGNAFRVAAKTVVLTAGAIETARLMLVSNRVMSPGLGNERDLVGRYFMEHPHVVTGRVILADRSTGRRAIAAIDRGLTGAWARLQLRRPSQGIKCAFAIREHIQREHRLLNYSAHLNPVSGSVASDSQVYTSLKLIVSNMRSLRKIAGQIRHRRLPDGLGTQIKNVLSNPGDVVRATYEELIRRPRELEVYTQSEAAPNPDSRVTLSPERDQLDIPRVRLDWRLSALDKDSARRSQDILGRELEGAGIGRVEMEPWLASSDDDFGPVRGGHHHLGTARMSESPTTGVVDARGRVHTVSNLYVGDGSVFPTGGFANPALTVVALALRLADYLKTTMT